MSLRLSKPKSAFCPFSYFLSFLRRRVIVSKMKGIFLGKTLWRRKEWRNDRKGEQGFGLAVWIQYTAKERVPFNFIYSSSRKRHRGLNLFLSCSDIANKKSVFTGSLLKMQFSHRGTFSVCLMDL